MELIKESSANIHSKGSPTVPWLLASKDHLGIVLLTTIFLSGVIGLIGYIAHLQERVVIAATVENARLYSIALAEFRTLYTSEVVSRVNPHPDFQVSHDYLNRKTTIPLPATLSMALGEKIGQNVDGAHSHLYSAYPFPWRESTGGLKDSFRKNAWSALSDNPNEPYYEFTDFEGRKVLRYATADLMRDSCVSCHNSHPDSPRIGWREGDLRGVLEVIHPMDATLKKVSSGSQQMILLAAIVVSFGLSCLVFLVYRFRSITTELERRVAARTGEIQVYEKRLAESRKMAAIGEISSGIAHEVNQPLGAIKLTTSSLQTALQKQDLEKAGLRAQRIDDQVDRIDKIITQLNTFQHGSSGVDYQPVSVDELVCCAVDQVSLEAQKAGVVISIDKTDDESTVFGHAVDLERVLVNLLTNAMHALESQSNRKIDITVVRYEREVTISVIDNGPGIDRAVIEKVFEPFFTTKPVGQGTGLGLSLCYGIIKNHGGTLSVENNPQGGARFSITLPLRVN